MYLEVVLVPPTTGSFSSRVQEAYCGMFGNPCWDTHTHTHTLSPSLSPSFSQSQ